MEHAGWKHFQVQIEQFNKNKHMNHINAIRDGGRGARAKVMEQPKERIDSVVYFSLWLTTAMEDAAWKHFQVEIEQFNKKRLMNHINLYVPKKCLFRNRIIRSRKRLHAISAASYSIGNTNWHHRFMQFWRK